MKTVYITFRSLTKAQRAKKELQRRRIQSELIRTPRQLQSGGCGYSLRMTEAAYLNARPLPAGYQRVYLQSASGETEALVT